MMHNIIIIRYGELALKGSNRSMFENRLVANIRDCLRKNKVEFERAYKKRGRIYVKTIEQCPQLSHVFGITSYSYAMMDAFSIASVKKNITVLLKNRSFTSFRVTSKRLDRSISHSSMELNRLLGQFIVDEFEKRVSLKHFDMDVGVEIIEKHAYVFTSRLKGPGGLPLGINGRAVALIENKRSILAAWLMMKRGLSIYPVAKSGQNLDILQRYNYGSNQLKLYCIKKTEDIRAFAEKKGIFSLVTGQTLRNIKDIEMDMLMLQPLVGFSDRQIYAKMKCL